MSKARFGSVLSAALAVSLSGALAVGCASSSASRDRSSAGTGVAKDPQPDDLPCGHCTVSATLRVTGQWQPAECRSTPDGDGKAGGGLKVQFPVKAPIVEVLDGEQAGSQFPVTADLETFDEGTSFEGTLTEDAQPDGWLKAVLTVTDAAGNQCVSLLSFDK